MTENMKKFLEIVSADRELSDRLNGSTQDGIIVAAKALGIELTEADFEQTNELSDDELDAVAGGGNCYCVIGGGGKKDSDDKVCACISYGQGNKRDGSMRCGCFMTGAGEL